MEAVTTVWPPEEACPECGSRAVYSTVSADLQPQRICHACNNVWKADYAESVARTVIDMLEVKNSLTCGTCDAEYDEGHTCAPGLRTKIDMLFEKLGQIEEKIGDLTCKSPPNAG